MEDSHDLHKYLIILSLYPFQYKVKVIFPKKKIAAIEDVYV